MNKMAECQVDYHVDDSSSEPQSILAEAEMESHLVTKYSLNWNETPTSQPSKFATIHSMDSLSEFLPDDRQPTVYTDLQNAEILSEPQLVTVDVSQLANDETALGTPSTNLQFSPEKCSINEQLITNTIIGSDLTDEALVFITQPSNTVNQESSLRCDYSATPSVLNSIPIANVIVNNNTIISNCPEYQQNGTDFLVQIPRIDTTVCGPPRVPVIPAASTLSNISDPSSNMMLACNDCQDIFSDLNEYNAHIAAHSLVEIYVCVICKMAFVDAQSLQIHLSQHSISDLLGYPQCNKACSPKYDNDHHLDKNENFKDVARHRCNLYGESLTGNEQRLKHQLDSHWDNIKMYVCHHCGYQFTDKVSLDNHLVIHVPDMHQCSLCDLTFKQRNLLDEHLQSHGKPNKHLADLFEKQVVTCETDPHHSMSHKRQTSQECSLISTDNCPLNNEIEMQKYKLICSVCGKKCRTRGNFNKHTQKCLKIIKPQRGTESHKLTQMESRKLTECEQNKGGIQETTHKCLFCKKGFMRKISLLEHMLLHTAPKAYICVVCNTGFPKEELLAEHSLSHTKSGPVKSKSKEKSTGEETQKGRKQKTLLTNDACRVNNTLKNVNVQLNTISSISRSNKDSSYCKRMNLISKQECKKYATKLPTTTLDYVCSVCGVGYTRLVNLTKHMLSRHKDVTSRPVSVTTHHVLTASNVPVTRVQASATRGQVSSTTCQVSVTSSLIPASVPQPSNALIVPSMPTHLSNLSHHSLSGRNNSPPYEPSVTLATCNTNTQLIFSNTKQSIVTNFTRSSVLPVCSSMIACSHEVSSDCLNNIKSLSNSVPPSMDSNSLRTDNSIGINNISNPCVSVSSEVGRLSVVDEGKNDGLEPLNKDHIADRNALLVRADVLPHNSRSECSALLEYKYFTQPNTVINNVAKTVNVNPTDRNASDSTVSSVNLRCKADLVLNSVSVGNVFSAIGNQVDDENSDGTASGPRGSISGELVSGSKQYPMLSRSDELCDKACELKEKLHKDFVGYGQKLSVGCTTCSKALCKCNCDKYCRGSKVTEYFQCVHCRRSFTSKAALGRHAVLHARNGGFICGLCGKVLSTESSLKQHAKVHAGPKPLECIFCNKRFARRSQMNSHFIHRGQGQFRCSFCPRGCSARRQLRTHTNMHVSQGCLECPYCGWRCNKKQQLLVHVKKHMQAKMNECCVCHQTFTVKARYLYHLRTHFSDNHIDAEKGTAEMKSLKEDFLKESASIQQAISHIRKRRRMRKCVSSQTVLHQ